MRFMGGRGSSRSLRVDFSLNRLRQRKGNEEGEQVRRTET